MMIKINSEFYAAVDQISEVKINNNSRVIEIHMKNGNNYIHRPSDTRQLYPEFDRIISEINSETI